MLRNRSPLKIEAVGSVNASSNRSRYSFKKVGVLIQHASYIDRRLMTYRNGQVSQAHGCKKGAASEGDDTGDLFRLLIDHLAGGAVSYTSQNHNMRSRFRHRTALVSAKGSFGAIAKVLN